MSEDYICKTDKYVTGKIIEWLCIDFHVYISGVDFDAENFGTIDGIAEGTIDELDANLSQSDKAKDAYLRMSPTLISYAKRHLEQCAPCAEIYIDGLKQIIQDEEAIEVTEVRDAPWSQNPHFREPHEIIFALERDIERVKSYHKNL